MKWEVKKLFPKQLRKEKATKMTSCHTIQSTYLLYKHQNRFKDS